MDSRSDIKKFAKSLNQNRWTSTILFTIIIFAVSMSIEVVFTTSPFVKLIVSLALLGPFSYAQCHFYLNYSRRKDISDTESIKEGFRRYGDATLLYCLNYVYTLLWTLLFIIPGIIKSYSYSQCFFILADNPEISPQDAIKKSCQMMDGHKLDLFILQFSFLGWFILGAFTFGIAYIYIYPYYFTANAVFYENLKLKHEIKMD